MLGIFEVSKWVGVSVGNRPRIRSSSSTQDWILNTEHMWKVQVRSTTKAKLLYTDDRWSRRKPACYMEVEDTLTSIRNCFDRTYASNYITLPIHEDNKTTSTPVDRDIPVISITRATAHAGDADYTWLYYNEGSCKEIKVLVSWTLQEIIDVADSGSTSTSDS